jgi:hypothetical protein
MRYYKWVYIATAINLMGSSLALVLSISAKDWSTATWSANAWIYTFLLRVVIRRLNNNTYKEDDETDDQGTNK